MALGENCLGATAKGQGEGVKAGSEMDPAAGGILEGLGTVPAQPCFAQDGGAWGAEVYRDPT